MSFSYDGRPSEFDHYELELDPLPAIDIPDASVLASLSATNVRLRTESTLGGTYATGFVENSGNDQVLTAAVCIILHSTGPKRLGATWDDFLGPLEPGEKQAFDTSPYSSDVRRSTVTDMEVFASVDEL